MAPRTWLFTIFLCPANGNIVSPGLEKCMDVFQDLVAGRRQTVEEMLQSGKPINVQLYRCHHKENQKFEVEDGLIKSSGLPGWCLTAVSATTRSNLVLAKCANSPLQRFVLTEYNYIQLKDSALCIDVLASETSAGRQDWQQIKAEEAANMQIYPCHDPWHSKRVNQVFEWAPLQKSSGAVLGLSSVQGLHEALVQGPGRRRAAAAVLLLGGPASLVLGLLVGRRGSHSGGMELLPVDEVQ